MSAQLGANEAGAVRIKEFAGDQGEERYLAVVAALLDYGAVPAPDFLQGDSLRPLVEGKDVPWRKELFLEKGR